ncbi:MAG: hypothetical protein D6675_00690 [Gemmatimonadetes bacterium]|nr:MAG: hypothetical protein D6675_00690 [Gemmatimonadota bacterium]
MAQKRLGSLLVSAGLITERELDRALLEQKQTNERLGAILVRLKFITTDKLLEFLSQRLNIKSVNLEKLNLNPATVRVIPEAFARENNLIAIQAKDKRLVVALADPTNYDALDQTTFLTGYKVVTPVLAADTQIAAAIDKYYGKMFSGPNAPISDVGSASVVNPEQLEIISYGEDEQTRIPEKVLGKDEIALDQLIKQMLADAAFRNASHIHIEPRRDVVHIRIRIDEKVYSYTKIAKRLERGLINKIKILANINTLTKKEPQDGFFQIRLDDLQTQCSVSVSTYMTYHGERMVLHLRKTTAVIPNLENMGIPEHILSTYKMILNQPRGYIVITGPYHHGKTTTVYATLSTLASSGRIIFSYEESLRDELDGVVQTIQQPHADPVTDLRAIIKQNPDVLYLSDISSPESYRLTMDASMGKMKTIARVHAPDAFGALVRFLDMGISAYLIANSVNGILAQRLIPRLCEHCKDPDSKVPPRLVEHARTVLNIEKPEFFKPRGCDECKNTGYIGHIVVYELLHFDKKISELVAGQKPIQDVKNFALGHGMVPLQVDALNKTAQGFISYEDMLALR